MRAVSIIFFILLPTLAMARPEPPALDGRDLKGQQVSLAALKGSVVVISFWATWCVPCKKELKILNKLLKEKQGLRAIAISVDGPETAADVRATVKRYRWTMPVIHDKDGSISSVHNPRGTIPYVIFIDKDGKVAHAQVGFEHEQFIKRIDALLAEKQD